MAYNKAMLYAEIFTEAFVLFSPNLNSENPNTEEIGVGVF